MTALRAIVASALVALGLPAAAQDLEGADTLARDTLARETAPLSFGTQSSAPRGLWFSALLGVQRSPDYFGSDDTSVGAKAKFSPEYLNFGRVRVGEPAFSPDPYERAPGFGFHGSFRFIGERDSGDFDELRGLDDIDPTLEIGGGVGYTWENAEAFADLRYGIGGSDGFVGELGMNIIARPSDRFSFRVGPRFLYGSDNYADTYFGISAGESARSGLSAHDADGGLISSGVEMTATYQLGERWWLEGGARWDKFQGDAADSPIVRQGSDDQTQVHIGVRRAFVFDF